MRTYQFEFLNPMFEPTWMMVLMMIMKKRKKKKMMMMMMMMMMKQFYGMFTYNNFLCSQ